MWCMGASRLLSLPLPGLGLLSLGRGLGGLGHGKGGLAVQASDAPRASWSRGVQSQRRALLRRRPRLASYTSRVYQTVKRKQDDSRLLLIASFLQAPAKAHVLQNLFDGSLGSSTERTHGTSPNIADIALEEPRIASLGASSDLGPGGIIIGMA